MAQQFKKPKPQCVFTICEKLFKKKLNKIVLLITPAPIFNCGENITKLDEINAKVE